MYRGRYVGRRVSARIEDTDRGACARKFNRDRMTKTPGAARDHGNTTLEITRHPFVPPRRTICRQALGGMRTPCDGVCEARTLRRLSLLAVRRGRRGLPPLRAGEGGGARAAATGRAPACRRRA